MATPCILGFVPDWYDSAISAVRIFTDGSIKCDRNCLSNGGTIFGLFDLQSGIFETSPDYHYGVLTVIHSYAPPYDTHRIYATNNYGDSFFEVQQPNLQDELDDLFASASSSPHVYNQLKVLYDKPNNLFYLAFWGKNAARPMLWVSSNGAYWEKVGQSLTSFSWTALLFRVNGTFFSCDHASTMHWYSDDFVTWTQMFSSTRHQICIPLANGNTLFISEGTGSTQLFNGTTKTASSLTTDLRALLGVTVTEINGAFYDEVNNKLYVTAANGQTDYRGYFRMNPDLSGIEILHYDAVSNTSVHYGVSPGMDWGYGGTNLGQRGFIHFDIHNLWYSGADTAYWVIHTGSNYEDITGGSVFSHDINYVDDFVPGSIETYYGDVIGDGWVCWASSPSPFFRESITINPDQVSLYKPYDLRVTQQAIPGTPYQPPQCSTTSKTIYTQQVSYNTGYTGSTSTTYGNTSLNMNYTWYASDSGYGGIWGPVVPDGYSGVKI